jgi:hypothetical protein
MDNSLYFKILQEHRPSLEDLNKKRQAVLAELQKMLGAPVISYMSKYIASIFRYAST